MDEILRKIDERIEKDLKIENPDDYYVESDKKLETIDDIVENLSNSDEVMTLISDELLEGFKINKKEPTIEERLTKIEKQNEELLNLMKSFLNVKEIV